jgi:hypothetical protein
MSANYNSNCNVRSDKRCCGREDTVLGQQLYANRTPFDLVAAEREMYDSMAPDSYDYIVSLRDSKRRYYSHWNHLVQGGNHRDPYKIKLPAAKKDSDHWKVTVFFNRTIYPVGNYTKWYMGQPDNYNVRMICGVRCSKIKKYQLTQDLFDYTLRRLANFSHILFVETMEESYAKFAQAYGWNYKSDGDGSNSSNKSIHHHQRLDVSTLSTLLATQYWDPYMSVLDDALYEFAQRKYHHDHDPISLPDKLFWNVNNFTNQRLVEEYFQLGPSRGCVNECCGECSKW